MSHTHKQPTHLQGQIIRNVRDASETGSLVGVTKFAQSSSRSLTCLEKDVSIRIDEHFQGVFRMFHEGKIHSTQRRSKLSFTAFVYAQVKIGTSFQMKKDEQLQPGNSLLVGLCSVPDHMREEVHQLQDPILEPPPCVMMN